MWDESARRRADLAVQDGLGEAMFTVRPSRVNPKQSREAMDSSNHDSQAEQRANELYWGSDGSVNQIAEDLDLSKGALYGLIRPLPTSLACPLCGADAVFPNRTARQRGHLICTACAWEGGEEDAVGPDPDQRPEEPAPARAPQGPFARRALAAGALLGAAAGLALVSWTRRRWH